MITVIKQDPHGKEVIHYQGELLHHLPQGVVIQARWTNPVKDLGYTRFEPGDHFTEYYYTHRWFNIFAIASTQGQLKGWYCNITEPARIFDSHIEQRDLYLDLWVTPDGETLLLDEDEFNADSSLSSTQRLGAHQGLQTLLELIQQRQEVFSAIVSSS